MREEERDEEYLCCKGYPRDLFGGDLLSKVLNTFGDVLYSLNEIRVVEETRRVSSGRFTRI